MSCTLVIGSSDSGRRDTLAFLKQDGYPELCLNSIFWVQFRTRPNIQKWDHPVRFRLGAQIVIISWDRPKCCWITNWNQKYGCRMPRHVTGMESMNSMERGVILSSPYLTDWSIIFILLSHDWAYCCGTMLLNTNPHDKPSHHTGLVRSVYVSCTAIIPKKTKRMSYDSSVCCPERYWINLDTSHEASQS